MYDDRLPPLQHPHLKSDWTRPIPPLGFDELCCNLTQRGLALDFVSNARRDFASQRMAIEVDWPWDAEFRPTAADWQAIGIDVVNFQ